MAVLQSKNLTLSPCRPGDRADFMGLERDPEVMRFLNGGHAIDREQSDPDAPFLMPRGTEPHVWTARRTANGAFVGWFCLWPESRTVAELGFRLRRMEWGQGLATEGAATLINWGFRYGGYDRIFACAMTVNHASRRVLEKIGLNYVRTVSVDWPDRFPGIEEGEVQYELLRSGWNGGSQRHEIIVREYQRSADLERILEIATALPAWFTRSGIRSMQADLRYQCGFVAEDGNKEVAGFISFFVNQGKAEIGWIGIRPDLHRQGVGRSLLHRLLRELESTQVSELYVRTLGDAVDYEPYQRTRKFYRQMGFQDFKRIANPENPECEEELILLLKLPV